MIPPPTMQTFVLCGGRVVREGGFERRSVASLFLDELLSIAVW